MTPELMAPAVFSACGRYRYALYRRVGLAQAICLFILLNPSTADAIRDDATVRRCIRFAREWGFGILVVANLFALRSTDPRALRILGIDPVGPDNDDWLIVTARKADRIVCGWGNGGRLFGRSENVKALLRGARVEGPLCLGLTGIGEPRHPLYLPKSRLPVGMAW